MSAFPPLLPYAFEASGIASSLETPLTGTWMVVRVLFVAFLANHFLAGASFVLDRCRLMGTLGFGLALGAGFLPGPLTLDGLWIHLVWTWCRGELPRGFGVWHGRW